LQDFGEYSDVLRNFRQGLPGYFNQKELPLEIQGYLNQFNEGAARATEVINNGGATANSAYLRDRLNEMMLGQTGTMSSLSTTANDIIARQGWTPSMLDLNNYVQQFMANGGFNNALSELQNVGEEILRTRGETADSRALLSQMQQIVANGGKSDETAMMFNQGANLFNAGGMTPQMNQLFGQIMQGMQSGGMTPEARQVFDKAMEVVRANGAGGALLPMQQVQSFARDEAATAAAQKA
jgi:hypothetical protein